MKLQLGMAAAFSVIALSAMAQPFGPPPPHGDFWYGAPERIHDRIDFVDHRLQLMVAGGRIARPQFMALHHDIDVVRDKEKEFLYHDGGHLSPGDSDYLWERLKVISAKINWDAHWGY